MSNNNNRFKEWQRKVNLIMAMLVIILLLVIIYITVNVIKVDKYGKGKIVPTNISDIDMNVLGEDTFPENTYVKVDKITGIKEYGSPSLKIIIDPIVKVDPNIKMWISTIKVKSAEQIKSAFAGDVFSQTLKEKTSDMAAKNNAVFAINGAACGFNKNGFVIRDKVNYRATDLDCAPLIIKDNGDFEIFTRGEKTGEDIIGMGGMHTYDFGPELVKNGVIVDYGDGWYKDGKDPRTAIGQKGPLEYVVIIVDGRSRESDGISFYDLALEFEKLGCKYAYALDGGGSTTLYFNGEIINNPSDWNGERKVSDILYFCK